MFELYNITNNGECKMCIAKDFNDSIYVLEELHDKERNLQATNYSKLVGDIEYRIAKREKFLDLYQDELEADEEEFDAIIAQI